ncbi:MAG: xanthan lyase, partial [Muribaculaceae bacterium]|nr:xanthan lyase [Muribaculaceae bacterium]
TRISAPSIIKDEDYAGFDTANDFGVPYLKDVSFTGYQTEYHRSAGEGFGKSSEKYVASVIAGNSFDYPALHGEAISATGRGFISSSLGAVEQGSVNLSDFKTIDLILGKQKTTTMGRGNNDAEFFTFPKKLRNALKGFLEKGGDLIVSGQYVASDLRDIRNDNEAAQWGEEVLCITVPDSISPTLGGKINGISSPLKSSLENRIYSYSNTLNENCYIVERPDALIASPNADESATFLSFSDTDATAGLLIREGKSRRAIMSVPFESITDGNQRNELMRELLEWIEK